MKPITMAGAPHLVEQAVNNAIRRGVIPGPSVQARDDSDVPALLEGAARLQGVYPRAFAEARSELDAAWSTLVATEQTTWVAWDAVAAAWHRAANARFIWTGLADSTVAIEPSAPPDAWWEPSDADILAVQAGLACLAGSAAYSAQLVHAQDLLLLWLPRGQSDYRLSQPEIDALAAACPVRCHAVHFEGVDRAPSSLRTDWGSATWTSYRVEPVVLGLDMVELHRQLFVWRGYWRREAGVPDPGNSLDFTLAPGATVEEAQELRARQRAQQEQAERAKAAQEAARLRIERQETERHLAPLRKRAQALAARLGAAWEVAELGDGSGRTVAVRERDTRPIQVFAWKEATYFWPESSGDTWAIHPHGSSYQHGVSTESVITWVTTRGAA